MGQSEILGQVVLGGARLHPTESEFQIDPTTRDLVVVQFEILATGDRRRFVA